MMKFKFGLPKTFLFLFVANAESREMQKIKDVQKQIDETEKKVK